MPEEPIVLCNICGFQGKDMLEIITILLIIILFSITFYLVSDLINEIKE